MGQLTLLRSMLALVEHQLDATAAQSATESSALLSADLVEADTPEAVFLAYIRSLGSEDLGRFRQEICLAGLREIDAHFASLEAR